ncbi:hypothetical protein ACFQRB_16935 [Halobaculum litoreum]|uniref:Uncharacterized protein n=1 Tax=Halobaculum litoreum TaxID=3031998 RepID=A0ABD5XW33_9EURY
MYRAVSVVVFPVPAPARSETLRSRAVFAASLFGFEAGVVDHRRNLCPAATSVE